MTKEYKPTLRERAFEQKRKANERVAKHIKDREEKFRKIFTKNIKEEQIDV